MLSAKQHWIVLRLAAVALIPLTIWLVLNVLGLIGAPYEVFIAWLRAPVNAITLIAFIVLSAYHAMLGVHEILEDYVHNKALLKFSMTLKCLAFGALAVICIYAVAKIAFISSPTHAEENMEFQQLWEQCQSDDECVALMGACGEWSPMNKRYQEEAAQYYKYQASLIECMPPPQTHAPAVHCIANTCRKTQ